MTEARLPAHRREPEALGKDPADHPTNSTTGEHGRHGRRTEVPKYNHSNSALTNTVEFLYPLKGVPVPSAVSVYLARYINFL